jgi:diketogulonate reductase-like aldo/keto reductase
MKYQKLSNGQNIPLVGLGTWNIGGRFEKDLSKEKEEIKVIQEAIKLGIGHIDTAEIYGNGQTETEVGTAIRDFERKNLFITTKVWNSNLHYGDVIQSLERSLKRLQTDYVDLYLIHWPNPNIPIKETIEAMEHLVDKGKVKSIGVSNFSVKEIKDAKKYLKKQKIVVNQIEYNLLSREAEKELIPFCKKNNIAIISYRPLAKGDLANDKIKVLRNVARKYDKTSAQIALKWLISRNIIVIPKSTNIDHLKQNLDIFDWELKKEDIENLEKTIPSM